jgi:hypothetical protein
VDEIGRASGEGMRHLPHPSVQVVVRQHFPLQLGIFQLNKLGMAPKALPAFRYLQQSRVTKHRIIAQCLLDDAGFWWQGSQRGRPLAGMLHIISQRAQQSHQIGRAGIDQGLDLRRLLLISLDFAAANGLSGLFSARVRPLADGGWLAASACQNVRAANGTRTNGSDSGGRSGGLCSDFGDFALFCSLFHPSRQKGQTVRNPYISRVLVGRSERI